MRKLTTLFLLAMLTFSPNVDARRRSARHPSPALPPASSMSPDFVLELVYSDPDHDGRPTCSVMFKSLVPTVAGTVVVHSVQKPGDNFFTPIGYPDVLPESGKWLGGPIWFGEDFYDVLSDGAFSYWRTGNAIFRTETTSSVGVKTTLIYRVPVPVQPPTGLVDRAVLVDRETILMLGVVSSRALLAGSTVDVSSTNLIKVPQGVSGAVPLTASWLLPSGEWECISYVIPIPAN